MIHRPINNLNNRIKLIRKQLEVGQKYMAASLGITKNYLSTIERGKRTPSDTVLIALMNRWGVMRDYLYEGNGEMFIPRVAEEPALYGVAFADPNIKDMLEKISFIYNQGDEDQKAQLYGHIVLIYNRIREMEENKHGGENRIVEQIQRIKGDREDIAKGD